MVDEKTAVYISLGSQCKWNDWEFEAVYHGLKKLGVRVVWSLKNKKIPKVDDPDFFIHPWVP